MIAGGSSGRVTMVRMEWGSVRAATILILPPGRAHGHVGALALLLLLGCVQRAQLGIPVGLEGIGDELIGGVHLLVLRRFGTEPICNTCRINHGQLAWSFDIAWIPATCPICQKPVSSCSYSKIRSVLV